MELIGIFKKKIYSSDKGYIIGLLKVKETTDELLKQYIGKTITFTGYFHELVIDDIYKFEGELDNHPKYGEQFKVLKYEKVKPNDVNGVIEFLSSDMFPGIGEAIAKTIVDKLGNNALNLILEDNTILDNIPKLTQKKKDVIINNLKLYEESNSIYVNLTEIGFNIKDSMSIYNKYKKQTLDIINNNIYQIINDIDEINFSKVDNIAINKGLDKLDSERIKACILYIMNELTFQKGDTYLEYEDIIRGVCNYIQEDLSLDTFDEYMYELEKNRKIVNYDKHYYLQEIFSNETYVAERIVDLSTKDDKKIKDINKYLDKLEKKYKITYNDKQKDAIINSLESNITIITGGPGTGKTTIIKAIKDLYKELNDYDKDELEEHLALLAPTGRASKRMSETTNFKSSTIHRYLKWDKDTNKFGVNEYNPQKHNLVIVDEVSMIDINLFANLLKGLTKNIKLVLVGDYNQLPSVGPGQILKDLIESEIINVIELDLLYRQDEDSYIPVLAKEINDNDLSENFLNKKSDYTFLECSSDSIRYNLSNLCKKLIEKGYDYKRVQVMAPMYMGENGIDNLNIELQKIFNPRTPDKEEITYAGVTYRENDKVLQLVNVPDLNVYNGDIGVIKKIESSLYTESKKDEITIDFDGNIVTYKQNDFNKIKHGFIISIHKSQGSEFELVILPICNSYRRMLYKKLLYTAITRAKKKLIVLGEVQPFVYAVNNDRENTRKTSLLDKLASKLYK